MFSRLTQGVSSVLHELSGEERSDGGFQVSRPKLSKALFFYLFIYFTPTKSLSDFVYIPRNLTENTMGGYIYLNNYIYLFILHAHILFTLISMPLICQTGIYEQKWSSAYLT